MNPSNRALALGLFVVACDDVYADPDGETVPTGVANVIPDVKVAPGNPCPRSRPRENSECALPGMTCEFGDSPDRLCNSILACNASPFGINLWEARPSPPCIANRCNAGSDIASLEGKPCTISGSVSDNDETVCNMTDGVCGCTTGSGGADVHERKWICVRPGSTACPTSRPLAGQSCPGTLYCDYGGCAFKHGLVMECKGNVWGTSGVKCTP